LNHLSAAHLLNYKRIKYYLNRTTLFKMIVSGWVVYDLQHGVVWHQYRTAVKTVYYVFGLSVRWASVRAYLSFLLFSFSVFTLF